MKIRAAPLRKLTGAMLRKARTSSPGPAVRDLHVVLLNDRAMCEINAALMRREGPTDVICLAYRGMPGMPDGAPAEIYINAQCAAREGARRKGPARELALYLAHGIDHLCGRDDRTPDERAAMRRRELRWLNDPAIAPIVNLLIGAEQ